MRRIPLIEEKSQQPGLTPEQAEADRVDYKALIQQVIRAPLDPQAGVGLEEMEKGLRILRALSVLRTGDNLPLEDADWAHLCEKVRAARWHVVDERLLRFSYVILNAEELPRESNGSTAAHSYPLGAGPLTPRVGSEPGGVRAQE